MISVLIVDDQELMRESLRILISTNDRLGVAGLAKDGQEAVDMVRRSRPDVVLMDIRMPELNGLECTRLIKEHDPSIKVVILTTFNDDDYVLGAIKNGADGFLLKGVSKEELFNSIATVYNGCSAIDPQTARKVFSLFERLANSSVAPVKLSGPADEGGLNRLELRIIQMIGKGCSNKEIMFACNLADGTVRNYISAILKKLDLRNRTQIAIFAIQSGIMLHDY
jgi:DNA-binding NarL/FixJ family response regulator